MNRRLSARQSEMLEYVASRQVSLLPNDELMEAMASFATLSSS